MSKCRSSGDDNTDMVKMDPVFVYIPRTHVDKCSNEILLGKDAVLTCPVEPAAASCGYKLSDSSFRDIMIKEVAIEQADRHFARSGYPEQIYDELQTLFKELEASPKDPAKEAKIFVDFLCRIAPEGKIKAGVYNDKTNVTKEVRFVFGLLRGVNQRNQATLFTMMNKSMVTES
ncbi:hypothetical protein O3P69_019054 [Scylla paramamosain]|uniref:Uncharacterized protein n=1 Tax=Scylla paramamosain TaxID=85552 RepID=A0AAW0T7P0_SCYPA